MSSLHLSSITFEHHPSGFGISHARPRISWKISTNDSAKGAVKNWLQESYEISILRAGDVDPTIYNTESSESVLVPWPGRALQSREEAHVKIRAHGRSKNESGDTTAVSTAWSSPATVETALLAKEEWEAKLTSSTLAIHDAKIEHSTPPVLFGKTFTLPTDKGALVKARLYITAQGVYQALLNGQRVGDEEMAPGWTSYKHRLLYQTFDVKSLLVQDKVNAFSVEVAEGWYAGRLGWIGINRCVYGSQVSFLAQLEVEFERGNFKVVSDNTWKSKKSAITRAEIYDGEDYDAREEFNGPNGDMQLDHDAWTAVEELAFPSGRVVPADLPPVRVIEAIDPVKVFKTKSGKVIMDFGQNLVGKLQVRLPAPTTDAAQTISFNHAEVMEHGELGTRPLRSAKPIDKVTLSAKQPTIWSPKFTFHGFRYAEIEGWPSDDGLPPAGSITALVLHSAMTRTGWFSCSDPLVNQLHQNVLWSMKGNFFSIPTDCPQRDERLGWTGDIQVFCPSANFLFDTASFLESWLQDVLDEQLEEGKGGIPGLVVPSCLDGPRPKGQPQAVWHDVTVLTPWDLYNSYGDINLLRKQYPSMKAWVDQGIARGSNGLWNQNNWNFGDWLDPSAPPNAPAAGRTDSVLVADAYLVRVLDTLAKISTLLGETEDAARYKQDATETRNAFQHEYVAPSGLIAGDTQTGYAMAICFGLLSSHEQIAKAASRLAHLIFAAKFRIATGFAGTPIITHALSEAGNDQLAYRMLLEQGCPSWLYPISMGATTIWERWDSMLQDGSINPGSMTSFNHYALGAVANWLHKSVGGISPLEPGWRKVLVKPVPGGTITSAEAAYDSPYGRISCSWKIVSSDDGDTFDAVVIVPPNTSAQVVLPGIHAGGEDQHEVGSGEYHFSCPYKLPGWPPKSEFARSVYYRE